MISLFLSLFVVLGLILQAQRTDISSQISRIVKPQDFSVSAWELRALVEHEIPSLLGHRDATNIVPVVEYFENQSEERVLERDLEDKTQGTQASAIQTRLTSLQKRQLSLSRTVEQSIESQIEDTFRAQGIYSPFGDIHINFPPVSLRMSSTPNLLVVSRRDRIESIDQAMLKSDLTDEDKAQIETAVDKLNVSSLVTDIGGLGATYPTFISNEMDLRNTLRTAAHEWIHQYLAFKPLGFRYVLSLLGISKSSDVTTLNETVADIVGNEIGNLAYEKYYSDRLEVNQPKPLSPPQKEAPSFDFDAEMRSVRLQVDQLLSQGKINEAESYMNEKRDYLASHGYNIRKLNQAYFAFYGSYSDGGTSVDPVGSQLRKLRNETSLKHFLERASALTSRAALAEATK